MSSLWDVLSGCTTAQLLTFEIFDNAKNLEKVPSFQSELFYGYVAQQIHTDTVSVVFYEGGNSNLGAGSAIGEGQETWSIFI